MKNIVEKIKELQLAIGLLPNDVDPTELIRLTNQLQKLLRLLKN